MRRIDEKKDTKNKKEINRIHRWQKQQQQKSRVRLSLNYINQQKKLYILYINTN